MAELLVPIGFLLVLGLLLYASVRITLASFRNVGAALTAARTAPAAPAAPSRRRGLVEPQTTTPSPPLTRADSELLSNLLDGMIAQIAHEDAMIDARGNEACVVRLVPQLPIRDAANPRSWLGGGARLPAGMAWPQIDGTNANLIAQICLSDLPPDIWDGLGPRDGWLAILSHPESWDIRLLHLASADVPHVPPAPVGPAYCWTQIDPRPGQIAHLPRVWPQWPVDVVAVRQGDDDPHVEQEYQGHHARYAAGYDLRDPGLHPFDWPSLLALCDVLEAWMADQWKAHDPAKPSPLLDQLNNLQVRATDPELSADQRSRIERSITFLPELIAATDQARAANEDTRARAEEIIAIVRETYAATEPFSANDAEAVVGALGEINWVRVIRENDPGFSDGAERVRMLRLPMTQHDKDATSWVYAYDQRHADLAKRVYCADPAKLPAPQRAEYEPRWREQAAAEMPSMGHIPMGYVHEFEEDDDVTIIEIPTGHLVDWMFGDCHHLVLTMTKADLTAGAWDRVKVQISN